MVYCEFGHTTFEGLKELEDTGLVVAAVPVDLVFLGVCRLVPLENDLVGVGFNCAQTGDLPGGCLPGLFFWSWCGFLNWFGWGFGMGSWFDLRFQSWRLDLEDGRL